MNFPQLPSTWAVVIALLGVLFVGSGAIVWQVLAAIRAARQAPAQDKAQELENEKAAHDIAELLREAQKQTVADMSDLLSKAREELDKARAEIDALRRRVTLVEDEQHDLRMELTLTRRALDAAVRFINRLVEWGRNGGPESSKPKPPTELHEYLDHDQWDLPTPPTGHVAIQP
jgi:uncharacterized coiled-coil protein SlyX